MFKTSILKKLFYNYKHKLCYSELSNSLSEKDIIEELTWKIETINKLDMLIEKIEVIFKNQKSIEFLENQLDQDRLLGGWNSNIKFK